MEQKKINLLYMITEYAIGGAEKAMSRILSKLDKSKYDITVVALRKGSGRLISELEEINVKTEIIGIQGKWDFTRVSLNLYKMLRKLNTQVLICSLYHPTILGRITGKLGKIPVIINWQNSENFGGVFRIFLNKITSSLSDKIICDSKKVEFELNRLIRPPERLVEVIPIGGINLSEYFCQKRLPRPIIEVGSVGSLWKAKGYPYMIEAAKIILQKRDDIFFSIAGDGKDFYKLHNLIGKLGLTEKFRLLGFQREIPSILLKWDIYVQPSLWEGQCITVIEAMASGLPVVATNVGGIPESVIDGYNGFLVPPRDPKALADKIIELIDNPELRTNMGERSRKIAEEKYSLDNMVNRIESLIESLIEKKIGLIWNKDISIWETGSIL